MSEKLKKLMVVDEQTVVILYVRTHASTAEMRNVFWFWSLRNFGIEDKNFVLEFEKFAEGTR